MVSQSNSHLPILIAEDDPDDRILIGEAFADAHVRNPLHFVEDGEQLLAYLRREGSYADATRYPFPALILLDLNMPRKNGREALCEIRSDTKLRHMPVVVISTSCARDDVNRVYREGVNSFATKPATLGEFVKLVHHLGDYWFGAVELPTLHGAA